MSQTFLSRRQLLELMLPLSMAVLIACGEGPAANRYGLTAQPTRNQWPPAFLSAAPDVQAAYRYAVANPRVLEAIPCYCGCAEQGHRSNLDCYVIEFQANDAVLLDQHGLGCSGCIGVTRDVMQLQGEGRTLREIRDAIDTKWKGAVPGTDTPLPPA